MGPCSCESGGNRPWDLEPGPKGELRGAMTTQLCFRMTAQAVGIGSPAGNAARRDPAQCSRAGLVLSQK